MLMPSPRHTRADLELWAELEYSDRAYGEWKATRKKAAAALDVIGKFAKAEPCYLGVSWGKDSVVAADLSLRAGRVYGVRIPLVWVRVEPICNPDCAAVRDAFLAANECDYHEIVVDCCCDADGWHAGGTLEAGFSEAAEKTGTKRYISGVRAEESGSRTLMVRRNGTASANSCRPLAWWTVGDVFGWLAAKELPVHPVYAMLGGGRWPREHLRVASLGGRRGDGAGRAEWEREYYGDVLRRLEAN